MGPTKKSAPSWSDVRTALVGFDRAGLHGLVQDLYAASKDNQAFLHARLELGSDPLQPYMATISRWTCPDVMKNQQPSIANAKKAISDYKKAIGRPEGVAELSVFFCEEAMDFIMSYGFEDESYFVALIRMFEQAAGLVASLPAADRATTVDRLQTVKTHMSDIGWGLREDLDDIWSASGLDDNNS